MYYQHRLLVWHESASPSPKMVPANAVTRQEFDGLLSQYPFIVESISSSKGAAAKASQKTLKELDHYRYDEAPRLFAGEKPEREMDLGAIKTLVEWKLRHGKFRPTLMSLVSSNSFGFAADTVQEALGLYRNDGDVAAALSALTKLRGIGPATASLLLTVHDPTRVIFFCDEAFYWLCCGGKKAPIKYNAKEYEALRSAAQVLGKRLDVSATDIEKVAYVLMKKTAADAAVSGGVTAKSATSKSGPSKRKAGTDSESVPKEAPVRRSKRSRAQ